MDGIPGQNSQSKECTGLRNPIVEPLQLPSHPFVYNSAERFSLARSRSNWYSPWMA